MPSDDKQLEILQGILHEVQDLNSQLGRTDERSRMNRDTMESIRTDRIDPLETQADTNENRSRRNSLIIGGIVTVSTIGFASILNYIIGLI